MRVARTDDMFCSSLTKLMRCVALTAGILLSASAECLAAETGQAAAPSTPLCRNLGLSVQSKDSPAENQTLLRILSKFEAAFAQNDSELFATLASASLQKKKDDLKKIFDGTVLEYDLKNVSLQRNSAWEITIAAEPTPGKTALCGESEIQPVYGPTRQIAAFYTSFARNKQTKILVLFGQTPRDAQKEGGLGLVLLQVQRWTYDNRTPEQLLADGLQISAQGEHLIAQLLADAAAKILESNPYLVLPLNRRARDEANRLINLANPVQASMIKSAQDDPVWTPEKFVPVFRDSSLAVGIKVRMKNEISLNEQSSRCRALGKRLFKSEQSWRKHFSGFECMPYAQNENVALPPAGGSHFFSWSQMDSK